MAEGALVNIAKVVLLLVNMAFMVAGAMLVYFSHKVKSSGWLDAFQGDYAWVGSTTFLLTLIVGGVVMALAALGCFGALLRQKLLLTIYAGLLIVTLGFFVVIAIGAHSVNAKATEWGAAAFPAVATEASLGENFNRVYCAAQVPYYCVDATANDVLGMFNQSLPGVFSDATRNVSSFCGVMNVPQVEQVCQVCNLVAQYKDAYTGVLDWANEQCPRNAQNQLWCGALLVATASGVNASDSAAAANALNAPYGQCRPLFFALIVKWSSFLMGCAIGVCAATLAVLALTLVLRCYRGSDDEEDDDAAAHNKDIRYSAAYARSNQHQQRTATASSTQYSSNSNSEEHHHSTQQQQQQVSGYDSHQTPQQMPQEYGYESQHQYEQQQHQQQDPYGNTSSTHYQRQQQQPQQQHYGYSNQTHQTPHGNNNQR